MKYIISIFLFFAGLLFAEAGSRYLKLVDDADKAIAADDYPRAIALLTEALKTEPDNSGNVMVMSNLGMLNYYIGRDTLAIYYLSLAHDIAPESVTILSNRAKVYMETGHPRHALNDLETITRIDSTMYRPYLTQGIIYLAASDADNARRVLDRMCTLTDTSKSVECTAALAWLANLTGDNREAVRQYGILIELDPSAEFYAARAMSRVALEEYAEASEDIAEGMKLNDECAELYLARACLNRRTYRNDDAMNDAQRAIDLGADKVRVKTLLNL